MSRQRIEAPATRPPRYGLVAAAAAPSTPQEWAEGWKFLPEACDATSGRVAVECFGNTAEMDAGSPLGLVEGDPFAIYATNNCKSTVGFQTADYEARARRNLENTRSFQIAQELWTGELAITQGLENLFLTDASSDEVTSAPATEVAALSCIEAGLADALSGGQGMVHMPPQILTRLVAAQAVRLDGTTYVTPNGHIVVPDAGYDGSGPGGPPPAATQWIYGTSLISLLLGDVLITPPAGERQMMESLDRATNTVLVYATQLVGYVWDECALLAAEVNVPVCAVGGS